MELGLDKQKTGYPRMTSFSDPKSIIQVVEKFHIKAECL